MRWTRWTATTLAILAVSAAGFALAAAAPSAKSAPASKGSAERAKQIARGEYLARIGGCGDCHTPGTLYGSPDFDRLLSGSELGWRGPWGVSYARNLTPDLDTGLGYYTEDEIANTLKTGVKPDGKVLLPPMPWPNTALMTDDDRHALAAYLASLKPVKHKVPDAVTPDKAEAVTGSVITLPPPPAWDAPKGPPPGAREEHK